MKTYMMTLKRMMMMALLLMVTVSAMADEQKIWLHISGGGTAQVLAGEDVLEFKDGMATVKDAKDKTITVSVKPDTGYAVESVTAQLTTSADNAETRNADDASFLTVKKESDTEYTFEMPKDFNVNIYVSFISTKKDPDPVEITTADDIDNNTKKLYLIQTNAFQSFYIAPQNDKITTNNILGDYMLWYFLDAGKVSEVQYYYIVNNSTGKYVYNSNGNSRSIDLISSTDFENLSAANKEKCKFKIVINETYATTGFYNINVKASQTYYGLNKQGGSETNTNPIRLTNNQYINDINSTWKFIPYNGTFTWSDPPFEPSTDSDKHFYKIRNVQSNIFYVSTDETPDKVTYASTESDRMVWYLKEAPTNPSEPWFKYYYIINPSTGNRYMYYDGTATNGDDQTDAVSVKVYDSENEDRYQFVVIRAARGDFASNKETRVECYAIIPKLLCGNLWTSNSLGPKTTDDGNMGIISSRGASNTAQWTFVTTEFSTVCADPTITFSTATGKVTISTTTAFSTIRYTLNGSTPSSTEGIEYNGPFDISGETTINAIVTKDGFTDSQIITKTIYQVATPTIQNNEYSISITTETEGATIYYTTNDSDPTTSSTEYTSPLTVGVSGTTIKAIAVKDGMINSVVVSKVGTETTLRCATPTFTKSGSNLTINCDFPSSGVNIYYIKNGGDSEPTTLYSGSIIVTDGDVIKAIAKADGYNDSYVGVKIIRAPLSPTDGKYLITSDNEFESFVDMANSAENDGYHYVLKAHVETSVYVSRPFTGTFEAAMDANGNFCTISGLTHPLFNTINGGTVKNVMLKDVKISGSGNIGAIAGVAEGYSRIYNCGILPSDKKYENETSYVSSSDGYCGGLVGWLKDDSRVINCFSYANITGGTDVAGIVGHNDFASTTEVIEGKYASLKTAVVNCMFYGNIKGGSSRYPVYGGEKIVNNTSTGINNYDFYRAEASVVLDDEHYNCSWPVKEEYLTKYEFYRYLLNSNRELCGWWVGAPSAPSTMTTTEVQAVPKEVSLMAKWVLDPSIAPYPILKPAGKYFSVINQDPNNRINPNSKTWESRSTSSNTIMTKAAPDTEGQKLGSVTVTINKGGGLSGSASKTIPITAMDINNNDFCYGKIQLPYYNNIFGNSNSNDWSTKYGGNYKDKVVVGWEITSATGTSIPSITNNSEHEYSTNAESGYNFADRYCTTKDENRVFAQGGYYYVPYGVSAITITAKWATATYLDNNNHYYDCISESEIIYDNSAKLDVASSTLHPFEPAGTRPSTIGNGKEVQNGSISSNLPSGSVYEKAIVLVGNHQFFTGDNNIGAASNGCTIMSADFDLDDEPDNCLIWELGTKTNRFSICPIRFDFLPVVEMGMALKEDASTNYYALGCYRPLGHFEVTETSLIHFGQFEFGNISRNKTAPLILNGGIYDQYTKGTLGNDKEDYISYIIIGGNVRIPSFTPGAHPSTRDQAIKSTRHCPVNVMGGNIDYLYLTGNYNDNITPNKDNPHCNIDGGNFKQVAAAGKEGIDGNVYFNVNHSIIQEFYGGSTMDQADGTNFKIVKGNIDVTIDNSMVTKYCGGPKFGSMVSDKTVTTRASGTTFGVYYGGGNGGTSYMQYTSTDYTNPNATASYNWESSAANGGKLGEYSPGTYYKKNEGDTKGIGYKADYEMEIVNASTGTVPKQAIFRTYFYAAQFSKTNTGPVTNNLTDCKVLTNFYGGGNLGGVLGNVTSTLSGTTHVKGSVFGAGYSASVPEVTIYNKDKTAPTVNVYTGIITPSPESSGTSSTYTWTNDNTLSTSNPKSSDGKYFFTEESLLNLGTITGNISLTLEGNAVIEGKVFNKDGTVDASKIGGVYGGGDESAVSGDILINIKDDVQVEGNVFGGGNKGIVSGSTTVNIED